MPGLSTGCPARESTTKPSSIDSPTSSAHSRPVGPGAWLAGVGVGVAGAIRRADGFVEFAPNLGWRGVPFAKLLTERLGAPVLTSVGNDGDLGALAEHVRGAGRGIGNLIYLSGEVGIGGGIVVEGRILTGAHGYAGELGHMMVNPGAGVAAVAAAGASRPKPAKMRCSLRAGARPGAAARRCSRSSTPPSTARHGRSRACKTSRSGSPAA